jgi:hypothetical protein
MMQATSLRQACRVDALLFCHYAVTAVSEQRCHNTAQCTAGMCTLEWFHHVLTAVSVLKLPITCSHLFSSASPHAAGDCGVPA